MIEIERKFLVKSDNYREAATSKTRIVQGFLNTHPERTVRVRIKGDQGFLTIKGKTNKEGTTRFEWEKEIKLNETQELLKLSEEGVVDKVRYEVPYGNHVYEVDEFFGSNEGLVIAELELNNENEHFEKPDWLGEEVTGEVKYYNSQLSNRPYMSW